MDNALQTLDRHRAEPQIGDFPFTGECQAAVDAFASWKDRVLDFAVDNPLESLCVLVGGSAWVLYLAERDVNPGINTYDDALYYASTCLSVGYANVFPQTQLGKLVAAIVMILGPSLSSWTVEGRLVRRQAATSGVAENAAPESRQDQLCARLDDILVELRRLNSARAGTSAE